MTKPEGASPADQETGNRAELPGEGFVPVPPAGPGFAGITSRGSVNYLIRNTQQQLVALSGQADLKASILITASSVVLTVGVARVGGSRFEWGFGVLAGCLLISLLAAVLCVLPSSKSVRGSKQRRERAAPNPLFFGDFDRIDEDAFVEELGRLSRDDATLYDAQARDLHRQGLYLLTHKFRYLRFGYAMFLLGFAGAGVVVAITQFPS